MNGISERTNGFETHFMWNTFASTQLETLTETALIQPSPIVNCSASYDGLTLTSHVNMGRWSTSTFNLSTQSPGQLSVIPVLV